MKKITFRQATSDDLSSIICLLANDSIGSTREMISKNISNAYIDAFQEIDADPNAQIIVMLNDSSLVGCVQLNFIRNLTYQGGLRCQVEGVRVSSAYQGLGLGQMPFDHIFISQRTRGVIWYNLLVTADDLMLLDFIKN